MRERQRERRESWEYREIIKRGIKLEKERQTDRQKLEN